MILQRSLAAMSILAFAACAHTSSMDGPTASATSPTVLAISPANSTTGVDPAAPIVVRFSYPMMAGMESLVVLHEGTITGPAVAGTAVWSANRTVLTFTPSMPLRHQTTYVLHLSPSLTGTNGQPINLGPCAALGGQYATAGMMGSGGMMDGSWGPGMMGSGWRAADGTYGMFFTFTTA